MPGITRSAAPSTNTASTSNSNTSQTSQDGAVVSASDVPLPPTEAIREGESYLARHLEVENVFDSLGEDLQDQAEFIDEYYTKQVKAGKYSNDKEGYREYVRKLEKMTDTKHVPLNIKLAKISEFIKYLQRVEDHA